LIIRRIYRVILLLLIQRIEEFEDLGAYDFVIAVDGVKNLIVVAVFVDAVVNVGQRRGMLLVPYQHSFLPADSPPVQVLGYFQGSSISGAIVDDDESVVRVLLLQDALEIPQIAVADNVIVGGDDYASMDLIFWLVSMIVRLKVLFLSFVNLFNLKILLYFLTSQAFKL